MSSELSERDRAELFLSLHSKNQHRISAFVHTLVANWQDAEEIVQDTLMILWKKFDDFDPTTDFFRWAARVAQFEVLNYRRRKQREAAMLDDQVINALAITAVDVAAEINLRREALVYCLKQLSDRDRQIISLRYRESGTVQSVAETIGRSTSHVHRILRRIRQRLLKCVSAGLSQPAT